MKIGQFFRNAALVVAMACPMFTSCYNDAALWDEIDGIHGDVATLEQKLAALEAKLNTDLQALQTLLEGKISALEGKVDGLVTVKEVEENKDGSVTITLSDDTKFTVFPKFEQDYTGLVTTVEIDGVLYWAVYGEDGVAAPAKDANDNLIPVVDVVPQVRVDQETALVEISFDGGVEWIAIGYNEPCVFEGAEVVYTDNWTDEEVEKGWGEETPMYVVLTLPDGSTISVTIDGVASFMFGGHMGGLISGTQYVSCGATTDIGFMTTNIIDWIKEVPAGWKVEEIDVENAQYGGASFRVTAPTEEQVLSGSAVAEGYLKVLAVAEGGKNVSASLKLTTKAFKEFSAGQGALTVQMNNGLGGYVVGVSSLSDYDPDAIVSELKPLIEAIVESPWGSYPDWPGNNTEYDYFEYSITDYPVDDLMSLPEMVLGEQYVVWALAVNQWSQGYDFGYSAGSISTVTYNNVSIELETTKLSFNDIQISAKFEGVTAFYGAFQMKYNDEDIRSGLVSEFNSSLNDSWGAPMPIFVEDVQGMTDGVYAGDPNTLVNGWQSIMPDGTYYLYIIPYVEGKTKYSVADMYYYEWTTEALVSGGTLSVTPGDVTVEYKSVSVPLTAEGAVYIYYKFVDPEMVSTITDKAAYLLENGAMREGGAVTASQYNMSPGTTMTLFAMAVDQNGCYGDVFVKEYSTKAMEFASAVVTAEIQGTPAQTGRVKISCDADVDMYYYWAGTADDGYWTSSYYMGGTVESVSAFFAMSAANYSWLISSVSAAEVPAEGIEITELTIGSPSVFVVSAKLKDGSFTKATVLEFTPEMDLGDAFVYATDDNGAENAAWVAAKPVVTYDIEQVGDFTTVTWSVEVKEGFTAKTACFSEDYLDSYPTAKDIVTFVLTYPYIDTFDVVAGETYSQPWASKGYNIYTVICDAEGNYYETYVEKLDITGGFGV
ncbi:MAG: hypothetical protein IJ504_07825 [Bacteroidales bacterium]|nr:hypothetical protein [Bacteroidales bacterium]